MPCPRGRSPISRRSSSLTPWVMNSTRCSPSAPRTPSAPYRASTRVQRGLHDPASTSDSSRSALTATTASSREPSRSWDRRAADARCLQLVEQVLQLEGAGAGPGLTARELPVAASWCPC